MKKQFVIPSLFILSVILLVSCMKGTDPCTPYTEAQDRHVIDSFLSVTGQDFAISYQTGGYYSGVLNSGSGDSPATDEAHITFDVFQKLLNGTVLDSARVSDFRYGDLNNEANKLFYDTFAGLQEGGLFRIIYLSRTAYGCSSAQFPNGAVAPANSQIIFDYKLVSVTN